jgi:hypothetical protein
MMVSLTVEVMVIGDDGALDVDDGEETDAGAFPEDDDDDDDDDDVVALVFFKGDASSIIR